MEGIRQPDHHYPHSLTDPAPDFRNSYRVAHFYIYTDHTHCNRCHFNTFANSNTLTRISNRCCPDPDGSLTGNDYDHTCSPIEYTEHHSQHRPGKHLREFDVEWYSLCKRCNGKF